MSIQPTKITLTFGDQELRGEEIECTDVTFDFVSIPASDQEIEEMQEAWTHIIRQGLNTSVNVVWLSEDPNTVYQPDGLVVDSTAITIEE
jgi:hypothetical protein